MNSPSPPPGSALPRREQELCETGEHETGGFIGSIRGFIFKLRAFISREIVTKNCRSLKNAVSLNISLCSRSKTGQL